MVRRLLLASLVCAAAAEARPKSKLVEIRTLPSTVKGLAATLKTEKPGDFREALLWSLETKLREKGTELTEPDAIDAMTEALLGRIFEEMAAANDVWTWEGQDGPRGDVLIRGTVKLKPGRTSSGFDKKFTVSPKGKRIDRGYLNTPCTVQVVTAAGEAEWFEWVGSKGWGAALHAVQVTDDVARVGLQLLSPGKADAPAPRHERPVWVAYFRRERPDAPWELFLFEPYTSKEQRTQESNLLPADPRAKLTDAQKKLVLALRMEDVRLLDASKAALSAKDYAWFTLHGLTEAPVDAKTVGWLDAYRTSDHPLVRAAAVLKAASLGGPVDPVELLDLRGQVKVKAVQEQALASLAKVLDASTEVPTEEDKAALAKLGGGEDVKVLRAAARVKAGGKTLLFMKGEGGWAPVK